jgi:hypothetical protein
MLDDFERRHLRRLNRLGALTVVDFVCSGIDRLTRQELRSMYARELDLLQSAELPQQMTALRNKYIAADGRSRGVTVRGTQMALLDSLGRIRRAMARAPRWRMKDPVLDAPLPADLFAPPAEGDRQDAVA